MIYLYANFLEAENNSLKLICKDEYDTKWRAVEKQRR